MAKRFILNKKSPVKQAVDQFLSSLAGGKGYSSLTVRNYRHYLKRFSVWMEENFHLSKLCDIRPNLIPKYQRFLSRLTSENQEKLKKTTQAYHLIALRSFLKYLFEAGVKIDCHPQDVKLPRTNKQAVRFLTIKQMEKLLSSIPAVKELDLRNRAILETIFSTGLRVSELVKLNRDQVDLKKRQFGVAGKGAQPRVVFLSERAVKWLERYLHCRQDNFRPLFIRYSGKIEPENEGEKMRLTVRSVQRAVKKYVKKSKIPLTATPHTLRHTFAADLLSHGADLESVKDMLGHKNIATTKAYQKTAQSQLRKIYEKFHSGNE